LIGPSMVNGATKPSARRAPTYVVVSRTRHHKHLATKLLRVTFHKHILVGVQITYLSSIATSLSPTRSNRRGDNRVSLARTGNRVRRIRNANNSGVVVRRATLSVDWARNRRPERASTAVIVVTARRHGFQ
jgi:hypothetical protein